MTIARAEIGTREAPAGSNRVKYNTWYYGREVSGSGYPWCMTFVQWCFAQAGRPLPLMTASCWALLRWYREHRSECIVEVSKAQEGDIVIFDFPGGAATDHCGILQGVGTSTVTTIDGNTGTGNDANGGAVMRRTRNKEYVTAVIRPQELVKASAPVLSYGAKGKSVKALQTLLNLRGAALEVDGSFGPATRKAVYVYQRSENIEVDGSVGPVTWSKLLNG